MNSHLNDVLIVKYRALTAGDLENHRRRMAKTVEDPERRKCNARRATCLPVN